MNSDEVRRQWADRTGEYSPEYYAYHGPNDTSEAVRAALDRYVDRTDPVLELGCSSGRHLAHLQDHGFEDLAGIEVNDEAVAVMAHTYPALATGATLHTGTIEDVAPGFADGQFGAVFSVETLQHLHPDSAWVFPELARIADGVLVTVENEGDPSKSGDPPVSYVNDEFPLYHRDWGEVFTDLGLEEVAARPGDRDTMRVFRVPG
ncbi:class I SAM-dependent methyltransferase [Halobacteriales archaeon QS_8_69_26]|nr:MAG: class I SAM-dependent methyltransferase [Halobacteriales archaeon QS_8_69_26]